MLRAFLIDPLQRTIVQLEHTGKLPDLYKSLRCNLVETLQLQRGATLWIDEEGKLRRDIQGMFWMDAYIPETQWDVAGRGLVLGPPDARGRETSAPWETLEEIQDMVRFAPWHPCGEECDGWHVIDDRVQACDESRRFSWPGYSYDNEAELYVQRLGVNPADLAAVEELHAKRAGELGARRRQRGWLLGDCGEI